MRKGLSKSFATICYYLLLFFPTNHSMAMNRKLFLLPLLCFFIFACEGEKIDTTAGSREIRLTARVEGMKTRVTNATWDNGDAIGIFMMKSGEPLDIDARAQNVMYVSQGTESFEPKQETESILFPFDGSNVDFVSYYPYRKELNHFIYPMDLTDQSKQSAIDLMYADDAKGLNANNPNVGMTFSHQLSKVVLHISRPEALDLSRFSIMVTHVGTTAAYNLVNGTLSAPTEQGNILLKIDPAQAVAEAILMPESDLSDKAFWFVYEEGELVFKYPLNNISSLTAFEKGTKYTFNVTLTAEFVAAVTTGSITDWNEGPTVSTTLENTNETPPVIEGSSGAPYTVAEAIAKQGKTAVWVKGYIVGSFDGSITKFKPGTEGAVASNVALADTQGETDVEKMIPVQLGSGALKNAVNLVDHPENFNKQIKIKGDLDTYYSVPGLKNTKAYAFMD